MHFKPNLAPGETPGAFMEPEPRICLNLATHPSVAGKIDTRKKMGLGLALESATGLYPWLQAGNPLQ
jgi:hypothetical protein